MQFQHPPPCCTSFPLHFPPSTSSPSFYDVWQHQYHSLLSKLSRVSSASIWFLVSSTFLLYDNLTTTYAKVKPIFDHWYRKTGCDKWTSGMMLDDLKKWVRSVMGNCYSFSFSWSKSVWNTKFRFLSFLLD